MNPLCRKSHSGCSLWWSLWDWHFLRVETWVLTPPWDAAAWTLSPCSLWPLVRKFLSPPTLYCPSCYNPPCPTSDNICTLSPSPSPPPPPPPPLPSPPSPSLCLRTAKSRLWAAEYERNNGGLSGALCRRWERAAVLRPSQYLDVVGFLCPFFNPSGTERQGAGERAERGKRG